MKISILLLVTVFFCISAQATTYTYDQAGRVIGVQYDNASEIGYTHDQAGNITSVETIAQVDNTPPDVLDDTAANSGGAAEEDDGDCFIATAAYGSYFEPSVLVLREFRDNHLLTNMAGTLFVELYYQYSPPIADFISDREWLRAGVRVSLTPVVYAIQNPLQALLLSLVLMWLLFRKRLMRNFSFSA